MPQTTDQLKPCPFCGGNPTVDAQFGREWWVECDDCAATTGGMEATKAEAIAAWNARAVPLVAEAPREPVAWVDPASLRALKRGSVDHISAVAKSDADEFDIPLYAALPASLAPMPEDLILKCVPGGDCCDPQQVADAIREYFARVVPAVRGSCSVCPICGPVEPGQVHPKPGCPYGVPVAPAPEPCPRGKDKPEHSCTNRHQCWEPCGELGKSAEHARPGRTDPAEVDRLLGIERARGVVLPAANQISVDAASASASPSDSETDRAAMTSTTEKEPK
jgi:Lar family restriction alleviation protein